MTAQTDIVEVMETDKTNTMMNGRHPALTDLAKGTKQTNKDWVMYQDRQNEYNDERETSSSNRFIKRNKTDKYRLGYVSRKKKPRRHGSYDSKKRITFSILENDS